VPYEHVVTRLVEFSETDMAGIMHFSNYFRFMETAEQSFFRALGFSIHTIDPEPVGWPRVHAECQYRAPLRFEDRVEVRLLVEQKREKILKYLFVFRKLNEDPPKEVARGRLTVACVRRDADGKMRSVPIPKTIADKIEEAPAELLA
jgi:YbgC/YbaW family acyl-CoA thioester hydrolase